MADIKFKLQGSFPPFAVELRGNSQTGPVIDSLVAHSADTFYFFNGVDGGAQYYIVAYDTVGGNEFALVNTPTTTTTTTTTIVLTKFDNVVLNLIETTNNDYLIVGRFSEYNSSSSNGIIKLSSDGTIDNTFNSGSGFVDGVSLLVEGLFETSDNKYIVGGRFDEYSGSSSTNIIKLNSDGTIDNTFNSGSGFNNVATVGIETSGGSYLIGGSFTEYSGVTANRIVKLNSDGSIDNTFNSGTGFNGTVHSIVETSGGSYLIGGIFTEYSGVTANRIVKLNSDGSIDNTFNSGTGFNNDVYKINITTDNGYLIAGGFISYDGNGINRIVKLNSDGTIDNTFNSGTGFNNTTYDTIETTDNGYLVGGAFSQYSGTTNNFIIKLNSDGTIDNTFNSGTGFNNDVNKLIETSDGAYLVGGVFTQYKGNGNNRIIKLDTSGTKIW